MSSSRQQEGTADNTEYDSQVIDTFEDADEGMQQPTFETTRYEDAYKFPEKYLVNGVMLEDGKKVTYVGGYAIKKEDLTPEEARYYEAVGDCEYDHQVIYGEADDSDFVKVEGGNLTDSYFEVESEVDSEDDSDLVDEDPLED